MLLTNNLKSILVCFFLINCLFSYTINAQHWNATVLSITSAHGNNSCHNPDKTYNFQFNITLPPDVSSVAAGQAIRYRIPPVNNPPYTTSIRELNGYHSIGIPNTARTAFEPFGTDNMGSFTIRYDELWMAETIELELETTVEYIRVRLIKETTPEGETVVVREEVIERRRRTFRQTFSFELGDYLEQPTPILVNGAPSTGLNLDVLRDCGTYTLSSRLSDGADAHEWVLPDPSWLVSSPASLNSATIQIRPDFDLIAAEDIDLSDIEFRALQYCDGTRVKKSKLPAKIIVPDIQATKGQLCALNSTQLTIPSFPPETSVYWEFNGQKIEALSGQSTSSVELRAKGNLQEYSTVNLMITTGCGVFIVPQAFWLGTPLQPLTNPTGFPTVNIPYQSFQNFQITNHDPGQSDHGYTWTLAPAFNGLTMQLYNNTRSCRIWANQAGNYNYYVKRQNDCGWSANGGGAIRIINPQTGGGGGGIIIGGGTGIIGELMINTDDPSKISAVDYLTEEMVGEETHANRLAISNTNTSAVRSITSLRAYPNPARDIVKLQVFDDLGKLIDLTTAQVQVLDINGKQIIQTTGQSINVSALAAGVYSIQVQVDSKMVSTKLIVQ